MQEQVQQRPEIEWIILADSAEAIGGKVYMMGGGWDRIQGSREPNDIRHFAIALSIIVPWHHTNEKHDLRLEIVDEDGKKAVLGVGGEFTTGRPAGAVPGQSLRTPLALKVNMPLLKPGTYAVIGSVDGQESRRTTFHVHPPVGPPARPAGLAT